MSRERVKCSACGEYLTSAITESGPMDEEGVVVFMKMMRRLMPQGTGEDIVCGGCGGHRFDIVEE